MEERIMGLDLSTKATGYAIKINNELIESGCITSSSTTVEKRIAIMVDAIIDLIKKYDIQKIIIEEVHAEYTHNSIVNQRLNWLQGCVRVAVWRYNSKIKIDAILPNSWRSKIGIKTGRNVKREQLKIKSIEYVKEKYNKDVSDDEADSIGILDSYYIKDKDTEESAF